MVAVWRHDVSPLSGLHVSRRVTKERQCPVPAIAVAGTGRHYCHVPGGGTCIRGETKPVRCLWRNNNLLLITTATIKLSLKPATRVLPFHHLFRRLSTSPQFTMPSYIVSEPVRGRPRRSSNGHFRSPARTMPLMSRSSSKLNKFGQSSSDVMLTFAGPRKMPSSREARSATSTA
jgi:hypothetical protein